MSLLDDVSIVVTPNGYKAGELYAVVPTEVEGTELLTNEDFTNGLTGWGTQIPSGQTVEVTSNQLHINYDSTGTQGSTGVYQSILTSGKRYTTTIDVVSVTGTFKVQVGSVSHAITTSGIKTFTNIASSSTIYVVRQSNSTSFEATINSVSVKEITGADMDVTRATAATRVDEDGLVNYAEVIGGELVTDGEFPSNTNWNESNAACEIIGGKAVWTSAPNSTGFTGINLNNAICEIGKTYKITYTIDSITEGGLRIRFPDFGTQFNSSGTYPLTVTNTLTATSTNIYFQGLGTTTASISNVSVKEVDRDNVPRIDYTGGGCPHILAEPQRTNLLTYSEDFSSGIWGNYNSTVTSSVTTAPDGLLSGSKFSGTADVTAHTLFLNAYTVVASNDYTYSVFAKKNESNFIQINTGSGFSNLYANFDLDNGVVGNFNTLDANIESYSNGWFKCSVKANSSTTTGQTTFSIIESLTDARNPSFNALNKSVYIWGAQLEEGSYATSYIPTSGSTVTRNQDIFTRDGIGSLINSTEGVLFAEIAALDSSGTYRLISLSDGTDNNRVFIGLNTATGYIYYYVIVGGVVKANFTTSTFPSAFTKVAVKYKENDFALWVNGVEVSTDSGGTTFPVGTLDRLKFESGNAGLVPFFGKVKQLQVYKTALTNTQLAALTS